VDRSVEAANAAGRAGRLQQLFGICEGAIDDLRGSRQDWREYTRNTLQLLRDLQKGLESLLRAQRVLRVRGILRKDTADDLRLCVWIAWVGRELATKLNRAGADLTSDRLPTGILALSEPERQTGFRARASARDESSTLADAQVPSEPT
jgi:hypothetical protein